MPFVQSADGIRLNYEVMGDGPPLLLHLGAGCDLHLWEAAGHLKTLSTTYRCILFDHRGHGASDRPRGADAHHIDRYVDDIIALLDDLQIGSIGYWGYSNGIGVGMKLADVHPARLWALVGSGTFSRPVSSQQLAEIVLATVAELREHGWEQMIKEFEEQESEPVPEWMKDRIRATDIGQTIDYSLARPNWGWSIWDAVARISTPTLFVTGELEDPEDITAEVAAAMPDATRYRVPGLGHINAFLRSELVLPTVLEFFAAHAPSTTS